MVKKTSTFKLDIHKYLYGDTGSTTLLGKRPYKWGMTIHENANNPNTSSVDTTWWTSTAKRKSAITIFNWTAVSNNFTSGVQNTDEISFDYVPTGETWNISHYIIWCMIDNSGTDLLYPLLTGSFASLIVLNELQILSIQSGNLVISEQ